MNATDLQRKYGYYPIGHRLKKIQASDAQANDQFGVSVAVSDTKIVVGARYEDTTAGGAGSAYIFGIDGNEIAKIQASDAAQYNIFGSSVAVSDTRIVVGAPYDREVGTVTNPITDPGSAYIFDINGNEIAKIQASDVGGADQFGWSVAVSDTRIVVGAPYEDTNGSTAGSVYIFDINGNELAKIQASDVQAGDEFGYSVAVSDTRIVVGAWKEDTAGSNAGSVYIFDINGNQLAKIQASDAQASDYFGQSVAVSDTRIVVGAPFENTNGTYWEYVGSIYIFDINGNQLAKIQANDAQASNYFGTSVAVSDTRIVVGASTGAGSAYIFFPGFSPFGDLCAYYDLGDPTVLDTNFSWSDYTA